MWNDDDSEKETAHEVDVFQSEVPNLGGSSKDEDSVQERSEKAESDSDEVDVSISEEELVRRLGLLHAAVNEEAETERQWEE